MVVVLVRVGVVVVGVVVVAVGVVVVLKLCADLSSVPFCRSVSSWIGKTTVKMYIGVVK